MIKLNQEEINRKKDIWQIIRWRMNAHRITPEELAKRTHFSKELIERGINGEPMPITSPFLHDCVNAFGLTSARAKFFEETVDELSDEACIKLLKPEPAMPPRQGNFWEYQEG